MLLDLCTPDLGPVPHFDQFCVHDQIIALPHKLSDEHLADAEALPDVLWSAMLRRHMFDHAVCEHADSSNF